MSQAVPRPRVIVHMASAIDGRIQERRWSAFAGDLGYEAVHAALKGDAWMCGRVTMRGYTRGSPADDRDPAPVPRTDHVASTDAEGYAVALDFSGRLHWGWRNEIEGDHVIVVLGEGVADAHLNGLIASGVSYLFAGAEHLDLSLALSKLHAQFGIERLLVEGGGGLNGAFLKAGLVDEISLLLAPVIDGGRGVPAVFDYPVAEGDAPAGKGMQLTLTACEPMPNGVVKLRYAVAAS